MDVSAATAAGTSSVRSSSQSLAANFDTFLKLLTTQLQNQDPLAPMDANEFTSQLVEFASVEQAIQTNSKLGQLATLIESSGTTSAMGMLGREVTVGDRSRRPRRQRRRAIRYRLPEAAAQDHGHASWTRRAAPCAASPAAPPRARTWCAGTAWTAPAGARPPATTRSASRRRAPTAPRSRPSSTSPARSKGIEPGADGISLVVAGATVPMSAVRTVREPQPTGDAA